MKPEVTDVHRRVEYAQSHDLARKALPITLWGLAVGMLMLASFDGRTIQPKHYWAGMAIIAMAIAFLGVVVYRLKQPSVPRIVLTRDGVLFKEFSEKIIPWNEIIGIGVAKVSMPRDLTSTRVTKLVVSRSFYDRSARSDFLSGVTALEGDPSEIYLAYFQPPPFDEFQTAVRLRWQAFSRHAPQSSRADGSAFDPAPHSPASGVPRPPRGVVERASALASLSNVAVRLSQASPLQLLGNVTALAMIAALSTNMAGVWATQSQIDGRAEAEKWRKLREQWAAEEKARAAERKRFDDRMERAFRCMDIQREEARRGVTKRDPDCSPDAR